jgi:hypothetical protein
LGRWCAGKKIERERQKRCFSKKKVSVPLSSPRPGRQDAAPRRCGVAPFASGPPPPLPPAPQRPCPFGIRALLARLHPHTPRPRGTGTRVAAVQQELHTERQPAPAAVHRKNPTRRFPQTRVRRPLAQPFCRAGLGRRSVHPQRAAPCTAHRSCKTSRDTHRTCLCHHAPGPCPTSCTPRKVRRGVWCAHTHSGLPRARGGARRLPRPQRHARGTRFQPRDTPSPCPHTHSLAAAHGPPCAAHPTSREACTPSGNGSHPRVSLRVPALHSPSDTAVPTRARHPQATPWSSVFRDGLRGFEASGTHAAGSGPEPEAQNRGWSRRTGHGRGAGHGQGDGGGRIGGGAGRTAECAAAPRRGARPGGARLHGPVAREARGAPPGHARVGLQGGLRVARRRAERRRAALLAHGRRRRRQVGAHGGAPAPRLRLCAVRCARTYVYYR